MKIKKLYRHGNSWAVIIPNDIFRSLRPAPDLHVVFMDRHDGHVTLESLDHYLARLPRTQTTPPRRPH